METGGEPLDNIPAYGRTQKTIYAAVQHPRVKGIVKGPTQKMAIHREPAPSPLKPATALHHRQPQYWAETTNSPTVNEVIGPHEHRGQIA